MSNLLQQLENNEAILLMYLAGELPEADHVEVEQMLVNDDALRTTLSELAALQADVSGTLARGETSAAAAVTATSRREASVRRVTRAMAAARLDAPPAAPLPSAATGDEPRRLQRIRWFAYPLAAAAILLVGIVVLSNRAPNQLPPPPEVVAINANDMSALTPRIFDGPNDPALDRIDNVEQQVLSLRNPEAGLFDPDNVDPDR